MKKWITEIRAINPLTGELTLFGGPHIEAPTADLAHEYCQKNGLGYCKVTGDTLVAEIPCKGDTLEPDWDNMIDHENIQNN